MKSIEIFAGCGGLALGMAEAGFEHRVVIEFDERAAETLRRNTYWLVRQCDVRTVDYRPFRGHIDLVSGGPPCQPFSVAGQSRAGNDPRDMFPEAARAVDEIRPRAFVFENVAGLKRDRFKGYFRGVLESLAAAGGGYRVASILVNAADYGVPQVRRRVFIVGFRNDLGICWEPPQPTHPRDRWVTVATALAGLPDPELQPNQSDIDGHCFQPNAKAYPGHTGSPPDKPAKALKAGVHGVPGGENMLRRPDGTVRYFSVREAARLQTFPDYWRFSGPWTEALRQLGNAVPVRLAEIIGGGLYSQLKANAGI